MLTNELRIFDKISPINQVSKNKAVLFGNKNNN